MNRGPSRAFIGMKGLGPRLTKAGFFTQSRTVVGYFSNVIVWMADIHSEKG